MIKLLRNLTIPVLFTLLTLIGCADDAPMEPAPNDGAVFQRPMSEVHTAARNALTKLNFAILKENDQYIEAVHLKPGETVKKNKGELVGVWLKPRQGATLVLIDTKKRPSGIAKQKDWEQPLLRQIFQNLN